MNSEARLPLALFLLRISVFVVMFMWTFDKFINPDHANQVYEKFYFLAGMGNEIMYVIGAVEMAIIIAFLFGVQKTWTYGFVLLLHAVSTLSSYKVYFSPYEGAHLLFFAAWPMLAACFALFYLRDSDKLLAIDNA